MHDRGKPGGGGDGMESGSAGTRRRLLAGAMSCLRERGFAGTTSRRIAREGGVNLAGITYHFGSKEALVREALLQTIRTWLEPALEILRGDDPPVVRMTGAVRALGDALEGARGTLPVYLEALVQASRNQDLGAGVRELFGEIRSFLAQQISELRASGFLPSWVEPDAMAMLLMASADGLAVHAAIDPYSVERSAVAGQVVNLLLAARAPGTDRTMGNSS